jgi:alpha-D-ribose 1-methylphosphonate 5-triphosphate synthase subunit PhnL
MSASSSSRPMLSVRDLGKTFTLHLHGGKVLPVLNGVSFDVAAGECVVLGGPSGAGKSSVLKMIHGNYAAATGSIAIRDGDRMTDIVSANAATVLRLRRDAMGYVSQFLRVIPRVSALEIVAAAARPRLPGLDEARAEAASLLERLNLPARLWSLPPATFSGGEQQRVNIARGFAGGQPLMILDEPTASLDTVNAAAVVTLIEERKAQGAAFIGIFHDEDVRARVADRIIDIATFTPGMRGHAA